MLRTNSPRRKGTVAVVVSVCLIGLLGFVALALDGGMLLDKRRQAQAAADAAAFTAACSIYENWFTTGGLDDAGGTARALALAAAKENGFEDGVDGVAVTVNIPPQSGPFTGSRGHVEVLISAPQRRYFSKVFGQTNDIPVGARTVARGMRTTSNNGIIVLKPTSPGTLSLNGNANVTITGGAGVLVNSNDAGAMDSTGGAAIMTAPTFDVAGIPGTSADDVPHFVGTLNSGSEPTPDPLQYIPQPTTAGLIVRSSKRINHSSATTINLQPGLYIGGISVTGKGNVILAEGLYYMQGGFSFSGQGSLTGIGVTIFNDPQSNSETIDLGGQGAITLSPPMTGPYQGICLFQSRTSTYQPDVSVTGSGVAPLSLSGTFYVPNGHLKITGNGTQDTIGAQYISKTLAIGGNGTFVVDWNPTMVPGLRQLWIVE